MTAYKTPWCGCCDGWVTHMRGAGWTVQVVESEDLAPIRARYFGAKLDDRSLVPGADPRLGAIGFEEWFRRSRARS